MRDFMGIFKKQDQSTDPKPVAQVQARPAAPQNPKLQNSPQRPQTPAQNAGGQSRSQQGQARPNPNGPQQQRRPNVPQQVRPAAPAASMPIKVEQRSGRSEATEEEVHNLVSFTGDVVSAENGACPLTDDHRQYVALVSPGGEATNNVLVISKSHTVHPVTSSARSFLRQNGQTWVKETLVDMDVVRQIYANYDLKFGNKSSSGRASGSGNVSETAVRQREFINLLQRAADSKASDIHVTIDANIAVVRMRVDGEMRKTDEMNTVVASEICQAAFAMADASDPTYNPMDYQGARVTSASLKGLKFPQGVQSVRLQFNPLPNGGRYMIARLLYSQKLGADADVDELGYAAIQVRQIKSMREKPFGINVISGPTGSGKSTTLQRGLTALMREKPGSNVVTIEDPPEYVITGAAQLPVTNAQTAEARGEKFRQAITAALRSDPDVIMIGEIRDRASAQLAFEAAMTGHGVWASLHANDGPSIVDRLRDQDIELYKLCDATLVTGLIGQRLLKKSRREYEVGFEEAVNLGFMTAAEENYIRSNVPEFINKIRFAGTHKFPKNPAEAFSGRRVVAEVIEPDQTFLDFMREEKKAEAVKHWKDNLGGISMLEHAFALMCLGALDIRELTKAVGSILRMDNNRIQTVMQLVTEQ